MGTGELAGKRHRDSRQGCKTGARRLAPLVPAAAEWLKSYKDARGPVIGQIKLYERLEKLSESAGVPWKQNALRHSFCSYRMATLKDAPRVSYEAGNSVRMINGTTIRL